MLTWSAASAVFDAIFASFKIIRNGVLQKPIVVDVLLAPSVVVEHALPLKAIAPALGAANCRSGRVALELSMTHSAQLHSVDPTACVQSSVMLMVVHAVF